MYKVLLVDDEYMITRRGLKRLIPFWKMGYEVVATANRMMTLWTMFVGTLEYRHFWCQHAADKTGLEMIGEWICC